VDLRLIEYFIAVVDHGGVTRAAQALYIAQPSLSQAIRTLERRLGVQLFDRAGRQLRLTDEGEAFTVSARRILADVVRARQRVAAVRELRSGRLDMAALSTLAVEPLPRLVSTFNREHPGVLVSVSDPGSPAGVVSMVRQGGVELGLSELPVRSDTLRSMELFTQEICLVLPPALAQRLPDPVPVAHIAEIPLVLEGAAGPNRTAAHAVPAGVTLQVVVECVHRQAIWALVANGAGATLLPRQVAEQEVTGVVVRSTTPRLERPVGLVFRPGALSPAAQAFIDCVRRLYPPPAPVPAQ